MTNEEIEEIAELSGLYLYKTNEELIYCLTYFAKLVAEKEREALEVELLKLKQGVASNSDYIQGRWDLIGEFQDIIRARGQE
jgi:hypothetical protein